MRYSRMFQYLFRLKRLQLELELSWAALKNQAGRRAGAGPRGSPPLWQVRSHMAQFVNNLQLYIQASQDLKIFLQASAARTRCGKALPASWTRCQVQHSTVHRASQSNRGQKMLPGTQGARYSLAPVLARELPRKCAACLQVDVIEVQSHKLAATMAEVRDLKAASRAHEAFLAACVVQSCLDVPMFTTLLSKILVTCKAFCDVLQVSACA